MLSSGFTNEIIIPTYAAHALKENTSLLDRTCANLDGDCKSYVTVPNLSDHFAVALHLFRFNLKKVQLNLKNVQFNLK